MGLWSRLPVVLSHTEDHGLCNGLKQHGQLRSNFDIAQFNIFPLKPMSQYIPFLDDPIPGRQPGDLGESEKWWAERQEALERAGYLLRSRYRPGWQPSWTGTGKFYSNFEDGQRVLVSLNTPSLELLVLMTPDAPGNGRNSHL